MAALPATCTSPVFHCQGRKPMMSCLGTRVHGLGRYMWLGSGRLWENICYHLLRTGTRLDVVFWPG